MKNAAPKVGKVKEPEVSEPKEPPSVSATVVDGDPKLNEEARGWLQSAFDAIKRNPDVIVSLALMLVPSGQLTALASKVPGAGKLLGLVARPTVAATVKPAAAATQQLATKLFAAMRERPELAGILIANMGKLPVSKKWVPARDVLKAVLGVAFKPKPKP